MALNPPPVHPIVNAPRCGAPWSSVSEGAKDVIRKLMSWHPNRRPAAADMLRHEWVATTGRPAQPARQSEQRQRQAEEDGSVSDGSFSSKMSCDTARSESSAGAGDGAQHQILRRLRSFASLPPPHRAAALALAPSLPHDQVKGLRELFGSMARVDSGLLGAGELVGGFARRAVEVEGSEAEALVAAADAEGKGHLTEAEFLAATLPPALLSAVQGITPAQQEQQEEEQPQSPVAAAPRKAPLGASSTAHLNTHSTPPPPAAAAPAKPPPALRAPPQQPPAVGALEQKRGSENKAGRSGSDVSMTSSVFLSDAI
jgi:hypothetical protein